MPKKKIFITGITGCVGHYLFDLLSKEKDYHLYLLIRNREKIKFKYLKSDNITIIEDHLENIEKHQKTLQEMEFIIHLAASWGGEGAFNNNYKNTLKLFKLTNPSQLKKIIYLSTASILDNEGELLKEAKLFGPPYIKTKFLCYEDLKNLDNQNKITTLFPTLIFGGEKNRPYSHISSVILNIKPWLNILRFFKFDLSFNFIHAKDIATTIKYFIENNTLKNDYVLGNHTGTFNQFLKELLKAHKKREYFSFNISRKFLKFISLPFRKRISPWDFFCLMRSHWEIKETVTPDSFGLKTEYDNFHKIISDMLR